MAWYNGVYRCGHSGRVDIIGPGRDRQWKIDRHFSGLCAECRKKEKEEEWERDGREAAERSDGMGLPHLEGTDRQVAWANVLRMGFVDRYGALLDSLPGTPESGMEADKIKLVYRDSMAGTVASTAGELAEAVEHALRVHVDAGYWIDSRGSRYVFGDVVKEFREWEGKRQGDGNETHVGQWGTAGMELYAAPDVAERKNGIVRLYYGKGGTELHARYVKDECFRKTVKELGFKWHAAGREWVKEINEYTGEIRERAAETGNRLLLEGYTVEFPDMESREAAVSGRFGTEPDRWVKYSNGELRISWKGRDDTLYGMAKMLTGARWEKGGMVVPVGFYREVEDFADTMGFLLSEGAREAIKRYMEKESGIPVEEIREHGGGMQGMEKLARILKQGGQVMEDLLDG